MKKKIMLAVIAAAVLGLVGCSETDRAEAPEESMMIVVDCVSDYTIYANKETKVMYLRTKCGPGEAVCVMLNADGTPQIWEG